MTPRFEYKMHVPEVFLAPLTERLAEYPGCARFREKYLFVLHLVSRQLRRVYHDTRMVGSGVELSTWHCNLQSVLLHAALGNDYNVIVGDLVRWGFIGRSMSYQVGSDTVRGRSKAFWFQYPYAGYWMRFCVSRERHKSDITGPCGKHGRMRIVPVKSRVFLKRLEQCAADVKARQLLDPRVNNCHESLRHFSVDRAAAAKVLDGMVADGSMTLSRRKKELAKVDRFNGIGSNHTALFVKKDRFGRIHTNVTQMKKEVRARCLYCDGQPTGGVDIKSSQGAFLGAILRSLLDTGGFLDLRSSPTMNELRRQVPIRDPVAYARECDRYDALLRESRLYEFFSEELSSDFDLDRYVGRDEAKHAFFVMLFGPVFSEGENNEMKGAVRRVWAEHFPMLLTAIERMKGGNYAALAREMQRIESNFMFDRVIPRVAREIGCPYCTVHDEIIVAAKHVPRVRDIMKDELQRVGVPTMTAEEFEMLMPNESDVVLEREVELEMLGLRDSACMTA